MNRCAMKAEPGPSRQDRNAPGRCPSFQQKLTGVNPDFSKFRRLESLQINLGDLCNLNCFHCHVKASPRGTRVMELRVIVEIIRFLSGNTGLNLDITGGCPELNPHFRFLIESTDSLALRRTVRTNLAVIEEPGMEWLPAYFRDHAVALVASLPCFTEDEVDRQRGKGAFARSIAALRKLNRVGYGTSLELHLAYNPGGDFLPGPQSELEELFRRELGARHGVMFNSLYVITNNPAGRFRDLLDGQKLEDYFGLLESSFNPDAAEGIMCRSLVNVGWDGTLYCCDFNNALNVPIRDSRGKALTITELNEASRPGRALDLGRWCFACTAGEGSSCTGALHCEQPAGNQPNTTGGLKR